MEKPDECAASARGLYGCASKFFDFERACQLKPRETISNRFGVYAIHRNFRLLRILS
jgi:hypothetical protein